MGRPPKNATDNQDFNADELLNEIEALKAENAELKSQLLNTKNTPRPTVSGIKITADHSIHYNRNTYLPGEIIENPPESDIDELLKFGELV